MVFVNLQLFRGVTALVATLQPPGAGLCSKRVIGVSLCTLAIEGLVVEWGEFEIIS